MTTVRKTLKKLNKRGVKVLKESMDATDFYYFSLDGRDYEFTNQPVVDDKSRGFCHPFENGSGDPLNHLSRTFYDNLSQLLTSHARCH